jgi:vesicle-associated membrane protein 7
VLLGKIDPTAGDCRMTIVYDNFVFHYVVEQQIIYLCMSDELNKYRVPYAFLSDVKDRFLAQYGSEAPLHAMAFCYNAEFAPILQERMDYYNNPENERGVDNIGAVKNQIDEVKENMVQNISNLLVRRCDSVF